MVEPNAAVPVTAQLETSPGTASAGKNRLSTD